MHISGGSRPVNQSEALPLLLDRILGGDDAILISSDGEADKVLEQAANSLAGLRSRVVRAAEVLPGFLRIPAPSLHQAGLPKTDIPNDGFLIQSYNALTTLDQTCDRIVLLVGDAQALQHSTLRYIQFVSRSGAPLQLIFCGTPEFFDLLKIDEFSWLSARLMAGLTVTVRPPIAQASPASPYVAYVPPVSVAKTAMSRPDVRRPAFIASMSSWNLRIPLLALFGIGGGAWLTLCMQSNVATGPKTSSQVGVQPALLKPLAMAEPRTQQLADLVPRITPATGHSPLTAPVAHLANRAGDVRDQSVTSPSMVPFTPPSMTDLKHLVARWPQVKAHFAQPDLTGPALSRSLLKLDRQDVFAFPAYAVDAAAIHLPNILEAEAASAMTRQVFNVIASQPDPRAPVIATDLGLHPPTSAGDVRGTNPRLLSNVSVALSSSTAQRAFLRALPPIKAAVPRSKTSASQRVKSISAPDVERRRIFSSLSRVATATSSMLARRLNLLRKQDALLAADDQWLPAQPVSGSGNGSQHYIGSYAVNANGVRTFHLEQ